MRKGKIIAVVLVVIAVIAIVVFGAGGLLNNSEPVESTEEVDKIPVSVETVQRDNLNKTILLGGLLAPKEEVFLAAKNPALKVLSVPVEVGDRVGAGTTVVVFDSRSLDLQLEQARSDYERNLQLFETGAVSKYQLEQLENALDNLKIQREDMVLTSPISGVVSAVGAVEGQMAGSSVLVSLVNVDELELEVQVSEANISKVQVGGEMPVYIAAASQGIYPARVVSVAPHVDARTKAYPVTLKIKNEDGLIKGGMYGEVELVVDSKEGVLVVPQYAVLEREQEKIVYTVEEGKAVEKLVEIGLTLGDEAEVVSGLKEGDLLIVEGQYGVQDGSEVIIPARGETQ